MNPQIRTCSGTVPGTSRNNGSEDRHRTEDRSLNDPYPEVEFSTRRTSNSSHSDREETSHMMTGIQEVIPNSSLWNLSGNQKKLRSISQPRFRNENTFATIEVDQILLAFQQLATSSNFANLGNNISRISKLPKSFTTQCPPLTVNQRNLNCLKICSKRV